MSAKEGKKDKLSQPPGSSGKPVIKVQRVVAFRATKFPENAGQAQLNCPAEILRAFQDLLVGTPILGATFLNPYTNKMEAFPTDARQLTSRHLQILARIEQVNTSGVMNTALYQGLLTNQQIATLRCLVKATNVAGVVEVKAVGGYGSKKTELKTSQKTILIDQAGLQWQGDLHNTGGLLFYPAQAALPSGYSAWQAQMYQAMYGYPRPPSCSSNYAQVQWLNTVGYLDFNLVERAIEVEFSQALDAAVSQGNQALGGGERINFKFLKAGMGFFADGLKWFNPADKARLELARLKGIESVLSNIAKLPEAQRRAALGKIARLELPFSAAGLPAEGISVLKSIETLTKTLGLEWGGAPNEDALTAREGFVNAVTNCGDPHAMIGNEGGYSSVDAAISSNASVDHLNAAFNTKMQLRASPSCWVATPAVAVSAAAGPIAVAAAPSYGVAQPMSQASVAALAAKGGPALYSPLPREAKTSIRAIQRQAFLKTLVRQRCQGLQRGQWNNFVDGAAIGKIEIGIGNFNNLPAIASPAYQIDVRSDGEPLVILDKHKKFAVVESVAQQNQILDNFLESIPRLMLMKSYLQRLPLPEFLGSDVAAGKWFNLKTRADEGGQDPRYSVTAEAALWEYGRSKFTGNMCFANRDYQVELRPDGTVAIQDKGKGYAAVAEDGQQEILENLVKCFPGFEQMFPAPSAAPSPVSS